MLYEMAGNKLILVDSTTFVGEKILERQHLQAALRDDIAILDPDLKVIAEEFGDFDKTHRRIDLLCVDSSARLVVVELKRTEDGGHMELQALRYAAMVSVMTLDDLVRTYAKHRKAMGVDDGDLDDARAELLEFFDDDVEADGGLSRDVRIVLASANFSQEVTTTVLWLNELYGTDIRCFRMSPYRHGEKVLLDVQQLIPLPEAAELQVKIKRQTAARKIEKDSSKDFTKYEITSPNGSSGVLGKSQAVLLMMQEVHAAGVPMATIAESFYSARLRSVDGELADNELWTTFADEHQQWHRPRKWFVSSPFHDSGRTWVLFRSWGRNTESALEKLAGLTPLVTFSPVVDPTGNIDDDS